MKTRMTRLLMNTKGYSAVAALAGFIKRCGGYRKEFTKCAQRSVALPLPL